MEELDVITLQVSAFLLVSQDLLSHVVDHHGTFKVSYGWISAILLADEGTQSPTPIPTRYWPGATPQPNRPVKRRLAAGHHRGVQI